MRQRIPIAMTAILLCAPLWAVGNESLDDPGGSVPALVEMKVSVQVNDAATGGPVSGAQVGLNLMLDSGAGAVPAPDDSAQLGETDASSACQLAFDVLPNSNYRWRAHGWVRKKGYAPYEIQGLVLPAPGEDHAVRPIQVSLRPAADGTAPGAR